MNKICIKILNSTIVDTNIKLILDHNCTDSIVINTMNTIDTTNTINTIDTINTTKTGHFIKPNQHPLCLVSRPRHSDRP